MQTFLLLIIKVMHYFGTSWRGVWWGVDSLFASSKLNLPNIYPVGKKYIHLNGLSVGESLHIPKLISRQKCVSTVVDLENSIVSNVCTTRSSEAQVNGSAPLSVLIMTPQLSIAFPAVYDIEILSTGVSISSLQVHE